MQDSNKRGGIGRIEVPKQKFVKSSIAWYSVQEQQKQASEPPAKLAYRNSVDFRSLDHNMDSKFEGSESNAIAKPSTTDNSVITREQRRKNYKNINDYLQLANLDSMAEDTTGSQIT